MIDRTLSGGIRQVVVVLLVLACMLFAGGAVVAARGGGAMPHFALPSARDGILVDSDKYQGQVLLVIFFATWCPPCVQEVPSLIELQKDYGPRGFSVLALSLDDGGRQGVVKLINKMGINYPVLMADHQVARDFGGIFGIPVSFLVDRQGEVIKKFSGYVDHSVFDVAIKKMMGDNAGGLAAPSSAVSEKKKTGSWLKRLFD